MILRHAAYPSSSEFRVPGSELSTPDNKLGTRNPKPGSASAPLGSPLRDLAAAVSLSGGARPAALLCLLAALFAGCAGYQLGPTGGQTAGARSIQINPFVNQTVEPRLVEALTHALRKQIQQDGTFRLDTRNGGDIVVSGTILRYERESISVRARDALTPRDYRITIVARVTARERANGKLLLDRELAGHTEVRAGADLFSAERQGIPLAAEFLATSATSLLADGPW